MVGAASDAGRFEQEFAPQDRRLASNNRRGARIYLFTLRHGAFFYTVNVMCSGISVLLNLFCNTGLEAVRWEGVSRVVLEGGL